MNVAYVSGWPVELNITSDDEGYVGEDGKGGKFRVREARQAGVFKAPDDWSVWIIEKKLQVEKSLDDLFREAKTIKRCPPAPNEISTLSQKASAFLHCLYIQAPAWYKEV